MIPNMPALGIIFNIDKLGSSAYGMAAWEIFWRAVNIDSLSGNTFLFEGDIKTNVSGKVCFVYCIVVQSDTADLRAVQSALEQSAEFRGVQASPPFVDEYEVMDEPLLEAGRIDSKGNLVGKKAYNARPALGAVRRERQEVQPEDQLSTSIPKRGKPASRRTERLPKISSLEKLLKFLLTRFGEKDKDEFWLTPEELCDIVENYASILQVQWDEGSCALSEDMTYVTLFNKGKIGDNIALTGLYPFASESDAKDFCYDDREHHKYLLGKLEKLLGIHGRFATNFSAYSYSNWVHDDEYDKEKDIDAFDLWPRIYRRRQVLGISASIVPDSVSEEEIQTEETVRSLKEVAKKRRQFWK